jgi:HemY protein
MKRLFIAVLLMLLLAAALAAAISYDPGYVLIAFGLYTLETTFWVGVAVMLAILLLMYLVVVVLHRSFRQGSVFSRWRANRQLQKGRQLTSRGILALLEGNFERARRILDRAATRSDMPVINYLMAARASAALGDPKQTQLYLLRAERIGGRPGVALELTQAEMQLRTGQLEQSLASLNRARRSAGKNPHLLSLLKDVYTGLRDWPNLLKLLPELRRQRVLPAPELAELELRATIGLLDEAAAQGQLENLRTRWREVPRAMARDSRAAASYARALIAVGAGEEAERIVRIQLKREWHRELVAVYGRIGSTDAAQQLKTAEQWLGEHGRDATLLLTLGRLSLRNQLWGKAREYFESSLKLEENPETCAELGRLLAQLGQHERSAAYYERGLSAVTQSLAPLPAPTRQRLN